MNKSPQMRPHGLVRRRSQGQSLPLIGLMLLVLVAMVGLSVDVGNTFAEEREAVSASNAASLVAMKTYIGTGTTVKNTNVYNAITSSLQGNGVILGDGNNGTRQFEAFYLNSEGRPITNGNSRITADGTDVPGGVSFIQVSLKGLVDTSFARVVGRPALPINATAHAGRCPPSSGVYPLGVSTSTISGSSEAFANPGAPAPGQTADWQVLTSGPFANRAERRLYVQTDFTWLRWKQNQGALGLSAKGPQELAESMSGIGNLGYGFEELASWPNTSLPTPAVYPETPGQLNGGDWIWGSTGWQNNSGLNAAVANHISVGTRLVLPIYDNPQLTSSDPYVRVVRLGIFAITGQGTNASRGAYLDMVFLGDAANRFTACSVTPPTPGSDECCILTGQVSFAPEYAILPITRKPIQYVVVLDVSGSMSANFGGQCNNGGTTIQCENGPPGAPQPTVTGVGPNYWWVNNKERRIYVAKKALERLVALTNMPGNAGYETTRPPDRMAVVWFTQDQTTGNTRAFSNTPATITSNINAAGGQSGDIYRTNGGTNGAAGLYRASLLYEAAPKDVTHTNGQKFDYKRVVVFLTDGVSNNFLDINNSSLNGGSSNANSYPSNPMHFCRTLGSLVTQNASCQTTEVGGTSNGRDRPITQMVTTSAQYLRNNPRVKAEVFVIALSNVPSTGLKDGVASSSSYFFSAAGLTTYADGTTNVDRIMDVINSRVEDSPCTPGSTPTQSDIQPSNFVNGTAGLTYPNVGEVVLTDVSNASVVFSQPVRAGTDGKLSYVFDPIPRGTYRMQAYLYYRHPLDPPTIGPRQYGRIILGEEGVNDISVTVNPSTQDASFARSVVQNISLKITGNVCGTP